jgi:hypothetical protein
VVVKLAVVTRRLAARLYGEEAYVRVSTCIKEAPVPYMVLRRVPASAVTDVSSCELASVRVR